MVAVRGKYLTPEENKDSRWVDVEIRGLSVETFLESRVLRLYSIIFSLKMTVLAVLCCFVLRVRVYMYTMYTMYIYMCMHKTPVAYFTYHLILSCDIPPQ